MIDLKNFSKYSKEYGFLHLEDILNSESAKKNRIAFLTDHSNMYASHQFINDANDIGIKPVIGLTINMFDDSSITDVNTNREITLYAKNKTGFSNLTALTHKSITSDSGERTFKMSDVLKLDENVTILVGESFLTSEFNYDSDIISRLRSGREDDFYFGIPPKSDDVKNSENRNNEKSIDRLIKISESENAGSSKLLAVNNNRFQTPSFHKYVRVKSDKVVTSGRSFDNGIIKSIDFIGSINYNTDVRFPISDPFNEMLIKNNNEFSSKFEGYELNVDKIYLPTSEKTLKDVLRERYSDFINNKIKDSGLKDRGDIINFRKKYDNRIVEEISLIEKLGFSDYFIIFEDFARNNPDRNFVLRGSAISSLATHILGLSNIDPVENGLLFERFLNENRLKNLELPDIDVETDDVKEIVKYMQNKYGYDHFVSLSTESFMRAKSQLDNAFETVRRDIIETPFKNNENRIMPNAEYTHMVKLLKENYNSEKRTFAEELENNDNLKKFVNSNRNASVLANLALIYENQVTTIQRVPASFAISNQKIDGIYSGFESVDKKDGFKYKTAEISNKNIESLGMVKIDILSNNYLRKIMEMKKKFNINIDLKNQDQNVYRMINSGHTSTINQVKSNTQSRLVRSVGVSNFNDIVNIVALIRPAVEQEEKNKYQKNKNGDYTNNKSIGHIIDETYGVIIFDEQVMKIAQDFGGFSPAESDDFRVALKNNNKEKLSGYYNSMTENALKNGLDKKDIDNTIGMINDTAGKYTFSKAHSLAYTQLIYEQSFLKENYPAEYMSFFVNSADVKRAERVEYIGELKSRGIEVLKTDINRSGVDFKTIHNNGRKFVDYPLAVKNKDFIEKLINDREANGSFIDIFDIMERMVDVYADKPIIELKDSEITKIKISIIAGINELTANGSLDSLVDDKVLRNLYDKLPPMTKKINSFDHSRNEIARSVIDVTVSKNIGKLLNPFDNTDFEYSEMRDIQKTKNLVENERLHYGANIDFIKTNKNNQQNRSNQYTKNYS